MSAALPVKYTSETLLLMLAREVAQDINSIESILEHHQVSFETWSEIKASPKFNEFLNREIALWNSAQNTNERVKIKAGAIVEESLVGLHKDLNNNTHPLASRNELLKTMTRLAGMGMDKAEIGGVGERFSVTINLGASEKLTFEKEMKTVSSPEVIEG